MPARASSERGPLVYVMGPSGAGKDTLLGQARRALEGERLVFAHRYITRAPLPYDENFVSLSQAEFALRDRLGLFRFAWEAHGLRYGVGREIELWRDAGLAVVVSGSRVHFAASRQDVGEVWPVLITATPTILADRLAARGRESAGSIEERLQRAAEPPPAHERLIAIDNSGPPEAAAEQLVAVLRRLRKPAAPRS